MGCLHHWTSEFQLGGHHIARSFLDKGWEVAFISEPISPFHIFAGLTPELKARYSIYKNAGIETYEQKFWTYIPFSLFTPQNKPFLKTNFVYENWHKFTYPNIVDLIKKKNFAEVDLLYIDSIKQHFLLDVIKYKKAVFRVADNNSEFSKSIDNIRYYEKKIAQKVDIVVYTASGLKEYVLAMKPKEIYHMPNGVNFEYFFNGSKEMPADLKNIPRPIAIYVGAISEWFDYALLNEAAKNFPKVSFVLIGQEELARKKLYKLPNIYLLGKKPYISIPSYLHNSDVGIIPFNVKKYPNLVNNINPLKLYEYMSCGLPVVSIKWEEVEKLNTPAHLAETTDEFFIGIKIALDEKKSKEQIYIEYAKSKKWVNQINNFLDCLNL